ncbi:GNAT family N-acetyltransferase [Oleiphilus sp. HI0125]|uniref:GNAT family N-acetyltransferase n=1 Tax=Oleiphilus sp. HI0125 TaxID=1822266 RepID=UPI0009ED931E|nr:GNAT family N-acetyltransferase [Oleiphilus sp. HI0125]
MLGTVRCKLPTIFFAENERADYAQFLDAVPDGYRVGVIKDAVTAAYGMRVDETARARIVWIMVAPSSAGSGVGTEIMNNAKSFAVEASAPVIDIAASHLSAPFFAKHGAVVLSETQDDWGQGMLRVDMD